VTVHTQGQPPARSRRRTHVPEPYDFRRPMTMAREHARVLEMAFETFARQWGNQLTARLRAMAQVTLDGLSLTSYDEYVRTLPGTTAMMLCTIEQTRQTAVVQVPLSTTMVWIDFLLGGPGTGDPREDRELTEIELTLLRGVMQAALGDLGYAFSALAPLDVTFRSVQYNPQFVQAVPASDAVLVAGFTLRIGEREDVATVMFLEGRVLDLDGKPISGATVDLWHANTKGNYSYFDKSQSEYNLRRRIITDAEGRYRARSIVPSGYGCDPQGPTQECLDLLGRHGQRPAHIHFFISAPGYRHLTTQINLAGDRYLWDDFAYATRDGLVGDIRFIEDAEAAAKRGVKGRFAELEFNFQLQKASSAEDEQRSRRPRALQVVGA